MVLKSEILKDRICAEIEHIKKSYSEYNTGYYAGRIEALKWVIDYLEMLECKK